ncbi:MAG: VOC family protein [Rhizobiaceae bacterium]|nr:VOC family protein [Rhizobiaceae bacterium]
MSPQTKPLDHLVLPVSGLDEAQTRYRALGFTVAPVGVHPFGTANCCIYLEDGTFLEPLAVADAELAERAVAEGNAFVAGDRSYRERVGQDGFAAIVLGTNDANADAARFEAAAMQGGDVLDFSREVVDKTGKSGTASFRLAFARDLQSPAPFFFTCERVKTPKVDRSALQHHRNRVTRLSAVVLTAPEPRLHAGFLETFFDCTANAEEGSGSLTFSLPNTEVRVETPDVFSEKYGVEIGQHDTAEGLRPMAVVFEVPEIDATASLFKADGIAYLARNNTLIVPPATGQGAYFIFEARA